MRCEEMRLDTLEENMYVPVSRTWYGRDTNSLCEGATTSAMRCDETRNVRGNMYVTVSRTQYETNTNLLCEGVTTSALQRDETRYSARGFRSYVQFVTHSHAN